MLLTTPLRDDAAWVEHHPCKSLLVIDKTHWVIREHKKFTFLAPEDY